MKKKFSTLEKMLLGLPLLVFCGFVPIALRAEKLSSTLQGIAGAGAKDCSCSTVPQGNKRKRAMKDCAANAFTAKRPFWMSDSQEANGQLASGWALAPDGRFYSVYQIRVGWLQRPQLHISRIDGVEFIGGAPNQPREIYYKKKVFLDSPP